MGKTLLEVKNLKKYFPVPAGVLTAVDDVTMQFDEGTTMGIVGESGCGKSTFGRTILRLGEPTAGEIIYQGNDITRVDKKQLKALRGDLQMIFQDPFSSLNPRMTVKQSIAEPLKVIENIKDKKEIEKRVNDMMEVVGIAQRFGNSYPHELDGGRRQRIGIARALVVNPKFIVCDEPVSALDVSIQAQVINLLQDLQKEKNLTYMFITHDLSVVKHISDNICVMYLGQVIEKCNAKTLFAEKLHPYTSALLSAIPIPDYYNRQEKILLKGEIKSPVNPKPNCRFSPRCPYASEQCIMEIPKLREIKSGHYCACHKAEQFLKSGI